VQEEIHYRSIVGRNMGHRSISDELFIEDSTFTSYLAAKAEMEDVPASRGAITSHCQDVKRKIQKFERTKNNGKEC